MKNLGFSYALSEKFKWGDTSRSILLWLREGAFLEDEGSNWQGFTGAARYTNHFHNPLKPWSAAGLSDLQSGESAVLWAQDSAKQSVSVGGDWSWQATRDYFYKALTLTTDAERQENFAQTFQGLGYQMHLIQDMSVPAHVRNDAHPEDAILGKNYWTGDYYFETWAKKNNALINSFASSPAFPMVSLAISYGGYVPITQFIDTDQYYGENPSSSSGLGLSEYTNVNFVSNDTIFTEDKGINHKHYFPYPRYSSNSYEMYEVEHSLITKRLYLRKKGEGEYIEHFVTAGPFYKFLSFDPALQKSELKLDAATHKDYAQKLIPRAVGYSAGLIDYFFRGDIDMIPDDATGSGYVIVNNADEDMNGTFELWYDNKNDLRVKAWSGSYGIGKKISGNNKSANIIVISPSDAKEPNKYMLVFKGKLGNEENAVVGRNIRLPEKLFLFLVSYDEYNYSLRKSIFEVLIGDNQYRLLAMPQSFTIPIQNTDPASHNYTVQSTDGNTKHSFSYPGRFWKTYRGLVACDYNAKLLQYGVALPSGYYQNEYQCHYGSAFISIPYYNWWLNARDGNFMLDSFGRHNYTLDSSNNIITFNDSIWRETSVACASNYVYRYRTASSGSSYINGGVVATDQLGSGSAIGDPQQGWIECQGPAVRNTVVAALGKGAALAYKNTIDPSKNQNSSETLWEYSQDNCTVKLYKTTSNYIRTKNQDMKIGGEMIDSVSANSEFMSQSLVFGGVGNCGDWGAIHAILEAQYPGGTYSHEAQSISSSDSGLKIMDYDNINGDEMYMVLYSKSQSVHSASSNFSTEIGKGGKIMNTVTSGSSITDNLDNELYLAYKTPFSAINKILLYAINNEDYIYDAVSCQMTKDIMTYTYVVKKMQGYEYVFDKRIIGVVNIANINLPIGYRKELLIDNENYPVGDFNFTQGAGIGIHKEMQ